MITLQMVVMAVVYVIVAGMIFALLRWLIDYCGVPEPFQRVAKVGLAILAVLVLISILLSFTGHPILVW